MFRVFGKKHTSFKWKDAFSGLPVSPGSAYFLGNIFAKNCCDRTVYVKIIASQRWDVFWDTVYIHFRGLLPPNGILTGAKFTLHPSRAFSYIGSVIARHWSSWASAKLCGVVQSIKQSINQSCNGITGLSLLLIFNRGRYLYSEGCRHVGHRPTF